MCEAYTLSASRGCLDASYVCMHADACYAKAMCMHARGYMYACIRVHATLKGKLAAMPGWRACMCEAYLRYLWRWPLSGSGGQLVTLLCDFTIVCI